MTAGDLTTLEHVKEWLGIDADQTGSDTLLSRMITSASRFVLGYLSRDSLAAREVSENYDGYGNSFMMLRSWPVISLSNVGFFGTNITQQSTGNPRSNGYILTPTDPSSVAGSMSRLSLWGWNFPNGRNSIQVTYRAGYLMVDEPHEILAAEVDPVLPPRAFTDLLWLENDGVKFAEDPQTPLTYVLGDAPAPGEYGIVDRMYVFNAADEGKFVLISYSYVPADIEQAVYQMVGEQYRYKDRIGVASKSLTGGVGETVTFSQKDVTSYIATMLQPYRRVVPV